MKIGVLAHDNGEFQSYCGFFTDPDRIKAAVDVLNAERLDGWSNEPAQAEVVVITLEEVPEVIDDAFLDRLAGLIEDGTGAEIERSWQRKERLEAEAEERADEAEEDRQRAAAVAPGQVSLSEALETVNPNWDIERKEA